MAPSNAGDIEEDDPRLSALSRDVSFGESVSASLKAFGSQYLALVLKNLRLSVRNWKGTVGILLAPILVVVFLIGTSTQLRLLRDSNAYDANYGFWRLQFHALAWQHVKPFLRRDRANTQF